MAKTKTPFLSLGSQGSVGESITTQKRHLSTLVRSKPLPTDPYTLPQAYQRWHYKDWAYLWTQQSSATRAEYRALGSREHLTAFQYWMKDKLATYPGLVAWWRLDHADPAIAFDWSVNKFHGTIFGASPTTGLIGPGRYLDGINDYLSMGSRPEWQNMTAKTLIVSFIRGPFDGTYDHLEYQAYWSVSRGSMMRFDDNHNHLSIRFLMDVGGWSGDFPYTPNIWNTYGYAWDGSNIYIAWNGTLWGPWALTGTLVGTDTPLLFSSRWFPWSEGYQGKIDNILLFNEAIDTEVLRRWTERGYPS